MVLLPAAGGANRPPPDKQLARSQRWMNVQADRDSPGRDPCRSPAAQHLHDAIEDEIAGRFQFQKADRLSVMGNIVLDWM
jgi:hypothetical protein